MPLLVTWNVVIVLATLVGGMLPLVKTWSERALHLFIALATGVFLGAVFLHLLPELVERQPPPLVVMLVPLSIFILFTVERVAMGNPVASFDFPDPVESSLVVKD